MSNMVRYCPACSSIGGVDRSKHINCCPDGHSATFVPEEIARQARLGFHVLYSLPKIELPTHLLEALEQK